jgi:hypothetical protein
MTIHEFFPIRRFNIETVLDNLNKMADLPPMVEKFRQWVAERVKAQDRLVTLAEGREFVVQQRGDGCVCPCCDQHAKTYRRAITTEMAEILVNLVLAYHESNNWVPARQLEARGGDYAKLTHWGLIEFEQPKLGSSRSAGGMRPTKRGLLFALDRLKVPSHVLLYNNEVVGFDGEQIGIGEVHGFNYAEVRGPLSRVLAPEHGE